MYPNGNKNDNGAGFLSLYVAIDNSTLAPHQEVFVDLRFYVFNRVEKKYLTIQGLLLILKHPKKMWSFNNTTKCGLLTKCDVFKQSGFGAI